MTLIHRALISILAAGVVNCASAQPPGSFDKVVTDYLCFCQSQIPDEDIVSYTVRIGTLEYATNNIREVVFHWKDGEEVINLAPFAEPTNLETWPPGFYNLQWAGLRTNDGAPHLRRPDEVSADFVESFLKTHKEDEIKAFIYLGINSEIIDVKRTGKTAVCRVDLKLQSSRRVTLWSMLPDQRGTQPSVPTKDIPSKPAHAKSAK